MPLTERELFFRHLGLPSAHPVALEITHAEGIYLYTADGKRYIDLASGVSVSNTGHRHPAVLQRIREQTDRYLHLMVYGEYVQSPQVRLAEHLSRLLPDRLNAVYFVNSGSEAIEGAMKLAKRFTGRREIIAFRNAYHGGTHGALSILGNESLKYAFRPLLPGIRFIRFNHPDDLEIISQSTACVVAETIQAEAGIILPEENFLKHLRKRCDETGALLVIDDIQMGFGRTGHMFSFEPYGIAPDILTLAKGMGGGMPVGAFISSRQIMDSLSSDPELGHITTFGGHPVSCAAALGNLEAIVGEKLCEQAQASGRLIRQLLENHPAIVQIRGKGLMMAVELRDEPAAQAMTTQMIRRGLVTDRFLFRPQAFRIAPPLIISKEEILQTCGIIRSCLDSI
ncbi:MAG: aspartate aminotransferase family protein [Bacteroidales bacterium]|nr:aspartate aminotransferase family protein [Bacteroidales bacterium]